jgi:hypothetical protein
MLTKWRSWSQKLKENDCYIHVFLYQPGQPSQYEVYATCWKSKNLSSIPGNCKETLVFSEVSTLILGPKPTYHAVGNVSDFAGGKAVSE